MVYQLLLTGYILLAFVLILIVLIQKGKSSMGLGGLGGGAQLLFGGSGGQDIFQKVTWVLGAIFMASSLVLAILKSRQSQTFRYTRSSAAVPVQKKKIAQPASAQQPSQQTPALADRPDVTNTTSAPEQLRDNSAPQPVPAPSRTQ